MLSVLLVARKSRDSKKKKKTVTFLEHGSHVVIVTVPGRDWGTTAGLHKDGEDIATTDGPRTVCGGKEGGGPRCQISASPYFSVYYFQAHYIFWTDFISYPSPR